MNYTIDLVKQVSSRRRYEYLREHGIMLPTGVGGQHDLVKGPALDAYIDGKIFDEAHPGQPRTRIVSDGVQPERKEKRRGAMRKVRARTRDKSTEG